MSGKTINIVKRIIDIFMSVLLLFLTAYQVTGESAHEWLGISMTVLLVIHNFLNRKWYKAIFKGKYSPYRAAVTAINIFLLVSIALTALSGMAMSNHAVPFMYGIIDVMTARKLHLAMSYWSFIFIGMHIGMHIKAMTAKMSGAPKLLFGTVLALISAAGLWFFAKSGIVNYIFFRTHFAFLDYDTAKPFIILKNLAMLLFWVQAGIITAAVTQKNRKN